MAYKLQLTSADILAKKFKADVKGYDATEVDTFLDHIITEFRHYEAFITTELLSLEKENAQYHTLKARYQEVEVELAILRDKFAGLTKNDTVTINQNNLELHKRISLLEKALYRLGQDPTKIK